MQSASFTPPAGIAKTLQDLLATAKTSIQILMYEMTAEWVVSALGAAKARGVAVQVVVDKYMQSAKETVPNNLAKLGIEVTVDWIHHIAHNKVCVIDDATVITGSYNWTNDAETANAENILVTDDYNTVRQYMANWSYHRGHSVPWNVH